MANSETNTANGDTDFSGMKVREISETKTPPLSTFRSRTGYQVTRLPSSKIKKADQKLKGDLRNVNLMLSKDDHKEIVDSMHDSSGSWSFLKTNNTKGELALFEDYESCLLSQRMKH